MKPQTRRKIPEKKTAKHKTVAPKETAEQTPPDSVLLGKYQKEATQAWRASKAAYPLRLNSPQAWNEWKAAVIDQYAVYKTYQRLFSPEPRTADEAKYGWDFRRDVELLRGGDATQKEAAIAFLEADPWFHGSGHDKVRLVRYLKPAMLTPSDIARLQNVVLHMVEQRNGQEFRAYCRLAKKVDDTELREQLTRRLISSDPDIRRRSRWVLEALEQKDRMGKPPSSQ